MTHSIRLVPLAILICLTCCLACAGPAPEGNGEEPAAPSETATSDMPPKVEYALAIHGGAGVIPKTMEEEEKQGYIESLEAALALGRDALAAGEPSLDVVEKVVRFLEDDPRFNAGKGAVFTHQGTHELDAAIMDGATLNCGAVSGIKTVKNPVTLARAVMERSRHVFLIGDGAEAFATEVGEAVGLERVAQDYFFVQRRYDQWQKALRKAAEEASADDEKRGTVGAVALDKAGNLAAATSTGGLTDKRFGRVGDVPVIGAGTYASNASCAVSATGIGEQFIRHTVARSIAALMEYGGLDLQEAAERVLHQDLEPGDGGVIAVSRDGDIALVFNSPGMFRGAADASGRFEVAIWE